ncbi:hypothetical protein EAI_09300 [Harpegnathos saltator]|uniref:DUF4806 domain-containing protein n=1 Tax=Harpegnathos saltator TaxID=610380 RepID=E2C0N3_HARSA|nr:hypothetical protein EAI_09300 [Harpegnathos saltator]
MIFRLYQNCGCKVETCANILHYKTDQRIRKAVEKEEVPSTNWTFHTVIRIFGEYSSLETADEKANRAIYTSDMDTEKEGKEYRKHRTKKRVFTSSESEEEPYTTVYLPPPSLPLKGGNNMDDAVKRSLYKLISNGLAEQYNWEGRRGKAALHNLELMKDSFSAMCQILIKERFNEGLWNGSGTPKQDLKTRKSAIQESMEK